MAATPRAVPRLLTRSRPRAVGRASSQPTSKTPPTSDVWPKTPARSTSWSTTPETTSSAQPKISMSRASTPCSIATYAGRSTSLAHFAPAMVAKGGGIVNISSIAGRIGLPDAAAYGGTHSANPRGHSGEIRPPSDGARSAPAPAVCGHHRDERSLERPWAWCLRSYEAFHTLACYPPPASTSVPPPGPRLRELPPNPPGSQRR